jgi:hypothetical protein
VTTFFVPDTEIVAGTAPFVAMGQNPFSAGTKLGKQMRELMAKGSIHFLFAMIRQSRIQRDQPGFVINSTGAGLKTRIPFDANE